jgi:hypothetical protein
MQKIRIFGIFQRPWQKLLSALVGIGEKEMPWKRNLLFDILQRVAYKL